MKNKLKKLTPLLLVALLVIGASAWLTNKEAATSINKISPGTFSVVFSNDEKRSQNWKCYTYDITIR